jgi:hypothetical protein
VVALLTPIQRGYRELTADPGHVHRVLADGAERARVRAEATVSRARAAIGLLPAHSRAATADSTLAADHAYTPRGVYDAD